MLKVALESCVAYLQLTRPSHVRIARLVEENASCKPILDAHGIPLVLLHETAFGNLKTASEGSGVSFELSGPSWVTLTA